MRWDIEMLQNNQHKSIDTLKKSFFSILYIVIIISIVLICIVLPDKIPYPHKNEYPGQIVMVTEWTRVLWRT